MKLLVKGNRMIRFLVRKELVEFADEMHLDYKQVLPGILRASDCKEFPVVNFNTNNCEPIEVADRDVVDYLEYQEIDINDIILVSTILADGFIKSIRGWQDTIEAEITS
jgi:hypothetical protein